MNDVQSNEKSFRPKRTFFIDSENNVKQLLVGFENLNPDDVIVVFHRGCFSKECKAKVHTAQHWEYSVPKGQEGETITGDKITVDGPGEYYIFYYCPDFNGTGYGADFGFKVR